MNTLEQEKTIEKLRKMKFAVTSVLEDGTVMMIKRAKFETRYAAISVDGRVNGEDLKAFSRHFKV